MVSSRMRLHKPATVIALFTTILLLLSSIYTTTAVDHGVTSSYNMRTLDNIPQTDTPTMNAVSVLISWSSRGAVLKAKSSRGGNDCFVWSTSEPDLIKIVPLHTTTSSVHCINQVRVYPMGALRKHRKSAIIYAQERDNPSRMTQCEVFIDKIARIALLTTVRKLEVGDLEIISVQGFDFEGNVFTSLNGLHFSWNATPIGTTSQVIQLLPLDDASVKLYLKEEKQGDIDLSGDSMVLKGVKVGQTQVSVQLTDTLYDSLAKDEVHFYVLDHFILEPSTILYLLPGATLQYILHRMTPNQTRETLSMPDEQFKWVSSNTTVGSVTSDTGLFSALALGHCQVAVKDQYFAMNEAKSVVFVVEPAYIQFTILPSSKSLYRGYEYVKANAPTYRGRESAFTDPNNLVVDVEYDVHVNLYDSNRNRIFITKETNFQIAVTRTIEGRSEDSEHIEIIGYSEGIAASGSRLLSSNMLGDSSNSTHPSAFFRIRTKAVGRSVLKATLQRSSSSLFSTRYDWESLSVTQSVDIFPRVQFGLPYRLDASAPQRKQLSAASTAVAEDIYLPVDETSVQTLSPKATGGSGTYMWFSTNSDVLSVDLSTGRITTKAEGESDVIVVDATNLFNGDVRKVVVSAPAAIEILPGERETAVGSDLCIQVSMSDARGNVFVDFSGLSLTWTVIDPTIYALPLTKNAMAISKSSNNSTNPTSKRCEPLPGMYALPARNEGFTSIKVKYKGSIQDKVPVAAYHPLAIVESDDPILIPLGSKTTVTLIGGPKPWPAEYSSDLSENALAQYKDKISLQFIEKQNNNGNDNRRVYSIVCLSHNYQTIEFTVHHTINVRGAKPTVAAVQRAFSCQPPHSLRLTPLNEQTGDELVALPVHQAASSRVYSVQNNCTLPIKLNVFDKSGNRFTAIPSLDIAWTLSDSRLAMAIYSPLEYKGRKLFAIGEGEGALIITATINGYNTAMLKEAGASLREVSTTLASKITGDVELRITPNVQISPERYVLFRSSKVTLVARGGSGRFDFSLNNTHLVTVAARTGNSIELIGVQDGYLSVVAADTLQFPVTAASSATSRIRVADVAHVQLDGKRMLETGQSVNIRMNVLDDNGVEFAAEQHIAMNPSVTMSENIADRTVAGTAALSDAVLSVEQSNTLGVYTITGLRPGSVKLLASVVNSEGRRIFSQALHVHVYEALRVEPANLVLIPGAHYQLVVRGGPVTPRIQTTFTITPPPQQTANEDIATVNARGVVTAVQPGTTNVKVERRIPAGNRDDEFSATVTAVVRVVLLADISVPSSLSVYIGQNVPITIRGVSTAATGSLLLSPLHMQSPYFSVTFKPENSEVAALSQSAITNTAHSVLVRGVSAGRSDVMIAASYRDDRHPSAAFAAVVTVTVIERLVGTAPWDVLLPPSAVYPFKTNKDFHSTLKYTVLKSEGHETVATVDKNGLISAKDFEGVSSLFVDDILDNQVANVKIAVQRPQHIAAIPSTATAGSSSSGIAGISLPVGSDVVLPIHILSARGDRFSTANNIKITIRSTVHDIAQLSIVDESNQVIASTPSTTKTQKQSSQQQEQQKHRMVTIEEAFGGGQQTVVVSAIKSSGLRIQSRPGIIGPITFEIAFTASSSSSAQLQANTAAEAAATTTTLTTAFYGQINITSAIQPYAPLLHVGDVVTFMPSPEFTVGDEIWLSEDTSVVRVEAKSGRAIAIGAGHTNVLFKSKQFSSYAPVTVARIASVRLDTTAASVPFLTLNTKSASANKEYRIPLRAFDDAGNPYRVPPPPKSTTPQQRRDVAPGNVEHFVSLECASDSPLATVSTDYDYAAGQYECVVKPVWGSSDQSETADRIDSVHVHVRVKYGPASERYASSDNSYVLHVADDLPLLITATGTASKQTLDALSNRSSQSNNHYHQPQQPQQQEQQRKGFWERNFGGLATALVVGVLGLVVFAVYRFNQEDMIGPEQEDDDDGSGGVGSDSAAAAMSRAVFGSGTSIASSAPGSAFSTYSRRASRPTRELNTVMDPSAAYHSSQPPQVNERRSYGGYYRPQQMMSDHLQQQRQADDQQQPMRRRFSEYPRQTGFLNQ